MARSSISDPPPAPPDDDRPRRRRSEPPPPRNGSRRWTAVLAYVLGAVLIVVGIACAGVAYRVMHDHQPMPRSVAEIFIPPPSAVFGKDRIYVLLLGIDYNRDNKGMPYSKGARSDTIMIAGIDFPSKSIKLISVLRDTDVIVNGREEKINQAYSDGGVPLADRVIGEFAGLPKTERGTYFDRSIVVNAVGLKDFVDAIGGVDVPVTETMNYDDNWGQLHIHFVPGLQHLSGQKAMEYSRFRYDACSDVCRTQRQQQIIHLTMAKLKSQKFNTITHIGQLIGALNKNVKTNLTFDEEKSLAFAFKDANLADLSKAETLKYIDAKDTTYAGQVVIPDPVQKEKLFAELVGPYGNVTPPPKTAIDAVKPSLVHVVVENGSGISGMATAVSEKLTKLGYVVDSVRNADTFGYDTTQIRPASKLPNVGERVRADLGVAATATVTPATDSTPGPRPLVTVIVGRDYATAGATAAPTASAAPAAAR